MTFRSRSRSRPDKPLTPWDRVVFGALASAFGMVLALGACVCLVVAIESSVPVARIVVVSGLYFFGVGAMLGPDAAFLVGDGFNAASTAAAVEMATVPELPAPSDNVWAAWRSPVLLLIWMVLVGVVAWRG